VEEFQAAEQDLIAIERRAALRGPGEEHLMEHIEALARERRFLRHDGAEATVAGTAHPSCEAAIRARSRLAGRTFSEIKAELGGLDPVIDVPASATRPGETRNPAVAAIKLTWRFDDGSSVRIDVTGAGTRPFVSGSQPHLARVAPTGCISVPSPLPRHRPASGWFSTMRPGNRSGRLGCVWQENEPRPTDVRQEP
jgi:hypothetical protein